jgi:hypothetical protein
VHAFPNRRTVEFLRSFGVRTVVLYRDRVAGTPWEDAPDRSVAGLPLTRTERNGVVIYEIPSLRAGDLATRASPTG